MKKNAKMSASFGRYSAKSKVAVNHRERTMVNYNSIKLKMKK